MSGSTLFGASDLDWLTDVLREVARQEIVPRFRRLDATDVRTKSGPLDLVTIADELAEQAITSRLTRAWPQALVVGEESCATDPSALDRMRQARLAFVVDPIDGTANFAAGVPLFATMVAVLMGGVPIAAVIYDPLGDEALQGVLGEGAYCRAASGERIRLQASTQSDPAQMTGKGGWRYLEGALAERAALGLGRVATSWDYRCAAYEYRSLINGSADFLLYGRTMPWDHLAGTFLHKEAGGYAARLDGSPYQGEVDGGLLCAPDPLAWASLRETLLG